MRPAPAAPAVDLSRPILDYDAHYRSHDTTPAQLMVDLSFLRKEKRFPEIEQAIQAYLRYHSKKAEPWMYLLLAVAFEVNQRGEANVRQALGWAGFLARRSGDAFTMIEVADVMLLRDAYEIALPGGREPVRAGELLDLAAEKAPQRPEPILMSILLAEETDDPDRLARAVERLFALGWPGMDETWRTEARKKVETMAATLEREGRGSQASALRERLARAEARDVFARLSWTGDARLILMVEEPLGATASPLEPRTVFGGAIIKAGGVDQPESVYVCPMGFDGDYKIRVQSLYSLPENPAKDITLEVIRHEGTDHEVRETHPITLPMDGPIVVHLEGGRRKEVLPLSAAAKLVLSPKDEDGSEATTPAPSASEAADLLRSGQPAPRGGTIRLDQPKRPAGGKP